MWAIDDGDKVKLLMDAGADVNADLGFRPAAADACGGAGRDHADRQAAARTRRRTDVRPRSAPRLPAGTSILVRVLLAAGARDSDRPGRGHQRAALATRATRSRRSPRRRSARRRCAAVSSPSSRRAARDEPDALAAALERGADVNAKDAKSRTPLMLAAMAEAHAPESIRLLLARGADPAVEGSGRPHRARFRAPPRLDAGPRCARCGRRTR